MNKKTPAERLADNLKALMGIPRPGGPDLSTGPKLAKASGVSQKTINNMQNGRYDTQLSSIEKVAKALKVDPFILLAPADEKLLSILQTYMQTDDRGRNGLSVAAEMARRETSGTRDSSEPQRKADR